MEVTFLMETKGTATALSDAIGIGYLEIDQAEFYRTSGGFLGLKYKGEEHKRVSLRRALPMGQPDGYISVADDKNKEIGVIRDVHALLGGQAKLIAEELSRRYYSPTVREIKSVKDKLGYVYMELLVNGPDRAYERNCAVKDVNRNIRMVSEDVLIIFDVDGNRYIVESLSGLDKKSLKRIEPYLF
jgi:hypothetical protein